MGKVLEFSSKECNTKSRSMINSKVINYINSKYTYRNEIEEEINITTMQDWCDGQIVYLNVVTGVKRIEKIDLKED